jgi:hypothetical protein
VSIVKTFSPNGCGGAFLSLKCTLPEGNDMDTFPPDSRHCEEAGTVPEVSRHVQLPTGG